MVKVIEVPRNASKKQMEELIKKIDKLKKGKMAKHFGALKRGLDGLEYQKKIRNEWS